MERLVVVGLICMRNRAAHAQKRCSANKEIFDLKAIRRAALRIARGLLLIAKIIKFTFTS